MARSFNSRSRGAVGRLPRISAEPTIAPAPQALALGAQRPPPSYVWDEVGASPEHLGG